MPGDGGDGRHGEGEEIRHDAPEQIHHPEELRLGGFGGSGFHADGLRVSQIEAVGEEFALGYCD